MSPPHLGSAGSWELSHLPLNFPPNARIRYRILRPVTSNPRPEYTLELARRKIVHTWKSSREPISVPLIFVDSPRHTVWAFAVGSDEVETPAAALLSNILFQDLIGNYYFSRVGLFPEFVVLQRTPSILTLCRTCIHVQKHAQNKLSPVQTALRPGASVHRPLPHCSSRGNLCDRYMLIF
jgi:hypothetical protein